MLKSLSFAVVTALTLLIGGTTLSASAASQPLSGHDVFRGQDVLAPAAGQELTRHGNRLNAGSCDKARAEAARLHKAGKGGNYGCITVLSPPKALASRNIDAVSEVPLPTNDCTGDEDGNWYALRTMQCEIDPNVKYSYYSSDNVLLGTALFAIAQQLDLSTSSLEWTETDQVTMLQSEGQIPALQIDWTSKCSATCAPASTKVWTGTPIALGQTLSKTYFLEDEEPTSAYDYLDMNYEVIIGNPDSTKILPPITWGGVEVRCDQGISVTGRSGCVIPWFTSTLALPRSLYGASVDMVQWAQGSLSGHWGLRGTGQPLHRLKSATDQAANRNAICGSNKFTADPNIPDDSCDEFPFAGTYESGALNGVTNGNSCAQVTAVRAGSSGNLAVDWPTVTPIGSPTGTEKCVRGHIPKSLNTDTGGAYGNFVKSALLADGDPFWLSVTP